MFPSDAVTVTGEWSGGGTSYLDLPINSTILYAKIWTGIEPQYATGDQYKLYCYGSVKPELVSLNFTKPADIGEGHISLPASNEVWQQTYCEDDTSLAVEFSGGSVDVHAWYSYTYVPRDISAYDVNSQSQPVYGDWLFMGAILLFLISFVTWGYIASIFKKSHGSY